MAAIESQRISKREFISRIAQRTGMSLRDTRFFYEAVLDELIKAVSSGETVVLTGFGRFYRQDHKGHKVRFGKAAVDDYSVLKFSASSSMNRYLESGDALDFEAYSDDYYDEVEITAATAEVVLQDEKILQMISR